MHEEPRFTRLAMVRLGGGGAGVRRYGLARLDETAADMLPVVAHLYGMPSASAPIDREAFPGMLLEAIRRVLRATADRGPAVVHLQDLHWADASTVTLVRELTAGLDGGVLLLSNYRPGYTPPAGTRVLDLRELSPRQTRDLLGSLLGGEPPEALVGFIEARADGKQILLNGREDGGDVVTGI